MALDVSSKVGVQRKDEAPRPQVGNALSERLSFIGEGVSVSLYQLRCRQKTLLCPEVLPPLVRGRGFVSCLQDDLTSRLVYMQNSQFKITIDPQTGK